MQSELYHLPGFHEPFSAVSHLFGAILFLFLGAFLLRKGWACSSHRWYLGVYAFACVLLMSMSGVYHMMVRGQIAHQVMERIDHSAIFVLIAGTFTPIHGLLFRGWLRWFPLLLVWAGAIAGITLKTIFFADVPEHLSLICYLGLGWFGAWSTVLLGRKYGFSFVKPLFLGGVVYSLGGTFDLLGWPAPVVGVVHSHDVLHLMVLVAAVLHWRFVWGFAAGLEAEAQDSPHASREGSRYAEPAYATEAAAATPAHRWEDPLTARKRLHWTDASGLARFPEAAEAARPIPGGAET